uniref:Leucine-rich repeat domain-containing protein n=1 Tax=Parastrongyloides trichosuri TaxID=131310 RepID=A0A0N4ZVE3_PARTI
MKESTNDDTIVKAEVLTVNISSQITTDESQQIFDDNNNADLIKAEEVVDEYCKNLAKEDETVEGILSLLALKRNAAKVSGLQFFMKTENYKFLESFYKCKSISKERMRLLRLPESERIPYKHITYNCVTDQKELDSHFRSAKSGNIKTMSLTIDSLIVLRVPEEADTCDNIVNLRINDKSGSLCGDLPKSLEILWFDENPPKYELSSKMCDNLHTIVGTNCDVLNRIPNTFFELPSVKYIVCLSPSCNGEHVDNWGNGREQFRKRIDVLQETEYVKLIECEKDPSVIEDIKKNSIFKIYFREFDDIMNILPTSFVPKKVLDAYNICKKVSEEQQNLLNGF